LALFVTATFLFTPYILNYDMVVFGFVVALLRERADNTMRDHWLLIRGVDAAGDHDVRGRDRDSAGADRAGRVRLLAAAALGARR
jgi:hypothetical protein